MRGVTLYVLVLCCSCGQRVPTVSIDAAPPLPDLTLPVDLSPDAALQGRWVAVPPGSFMMGSPANELCHGFNEALHKVTLTRGFEIWSTEVTRGQFSALLGSSPVPHPACGDDCPVAGVSWHQAARYCNALSNQQGIPPCYRCSPLSNDCDVAPLYQPNNYDCPGYRLPSESEWEYAARAGTKSALYLGALMTCAGVDALAGEAGWYTHNAGGGPLPVGSKRPNAWGLYDMAGNVWEWCADRYVAYLGTEPLVDPFGVKDPHLNIRGGSWGDQPGNLRSAHRDYAVPGHTSNRGGFRCVRTLPARP